MHCDRPHSLCLSIVIPGAMLAPERKAKQQVANALTVLRASQQEALQQPSFSSSSCLHGCRVRSMRLKQLSVRLDLRTWIASEETAATRQVHLLCHLPGQGAGY
jgi:hypothetical protein